jgi:hypothetical protein
MKLVFSRSRNFPHSMEPKFPYRAHKILLVVITLNQVDIVHIFASDFFTIHFNNILLPTCLKLSLFFVFSHSNCVGKFRCEHVGMGEK